MIDRAQSRAVIAELPRRVTRTVLLLGPDLNAVSGVSTHLNQLMRSTAGSQIRMVHFQVGSEGRAESAFRKLLRFIVSPLALIVAIRRHDKPIVHINTSMETKSFWRDLGYLAVSRLFGCKIVYQVHGGHLPGEFTRGNPILSGLLRVALRMPDVVVLLAQAEINAYQDFSRRLRPRLVANAIHIDQTRSPARSARPDDPLNLVYVGRLAAVKGIFEAVQAAALVRDQGVVVNLAIAGSGPDEQELRLRIADLEIGDRVTMKGALFGAEKDQLWSSSDAFIFPTSHREGLPYALLESMAAGTTPITCRVGAIPDVITHRENGLLVEPNDADELASAIMWLHNNRDELARLGEAARQRVLRDYTVARMADEFRRIYADI